MYLSRPAPATAIFEPNLQLRRQSNADTTEAEYNFQDTCINSIINYRKSHKVSSMERDAKSKAIIKAIDNLGFHTMGGVPYSDSESSLSTGRKSDRRKQLSEYTFYVVALFDVLYVIGLCPWKMIYDAERQIFVEVQPRRIRKLLILLLHISILLFCLSNLLAEFEDDAVDTLGIAKRIMLFLFLTEPISFQYNLWFNADKSVQLLTDIQTFLANCLSAVVHENCGGGGHDGRGRSFFWKRTQIYTITILLLIFYLFLGTVFSIVIVLIHGDLTLFHAAGILEGSNQVAVASFNALTFQNQANAANAILANGTTPVETASTTAASFYRYLIGIPVAIVVFYNNFTWLINYCEILLWGLMFRRILHLYLSDMNAKDALENIRQFERIARLVHDFNEIYGTNVLVGVLSCSMVSSFYIWELLNTNDGGNGGSYVFKAAMLTSIGLFALNLVVAAEINKNAESIIFALKARLQRAEHYWHPDENYHQEFIVGCMSVFHQIQNVTIGFRAFHFFTITYAFLAALLNIVATYSIMLLQYHLTATAATNHATYR